MDELGNEVATDVEGDEGLQAADGGAADEDGGSAGGVREGGYLVVVQFDDGRVDSDGGEELLHDVAHAAGGAREDDHRMLRYQPLDTRLRGFLHIDGERRGGGGGGGAGGDRRRSAEVEVDYVVRAAAQALHRVKGEVRVNERLKWWSFYL